ncbi:MAG: HipA domain-containing protein [Sulfuricellaceae bacterium]|nr:HipA domain-containing protein [Sulfuricellaceae bacterium]
MKRREALEAKDAKRQTRTLHSWDYLIGVQDATRQGALRFRHEGSTEFLAAHRLPAPPVASLRELEAVAREITNKHITDLDALRRWLSVLVAPGASLGGARPKANFTDNDGSLWIAKFPARDDDRDIGAWEAVLHTLALTANVIMPPARVLRFGSQYHTFCVQRFDRSGHNRVFYTSAMTMLKKQQSEGASYLDIAQFLHNNGAGRTLHSDLEQLFRRVVFNIAVSNRDDHLRNHGFLLGSDGWRLSPAFDVNPNIDKAEHVLNIDESDNRPNLDAALSTAAWYGLDTGQAGMVVEEILSVVGKWKSVARKTGISNAEVELMSSAFQTK